MNFKSLLVGAAVAFSAVFSAGAADQCSDTVDLLIACDGSCADYIQRNYGNVTNFAQQLVIRCNEFLKNSNLDSYFRYRMVGAMVVEPSATGNGAQRIVSALSSARYASSTSAWYPIHEVRDQVGADIVAVFTNAGRGGSTGGATYTDGIGSTDVAAIATQATRGYCGLSIQDVDATTHTMPHEIGHVMGAGHADTQSTDPGPQSWDYSSGYHFKGADNKWYHTTMAYNSSTKEGVWGVLECAPLFSSPDVTWAGVPAGDALHNNRQVLLNTYQAIRSWRDQVIPLNYDTFISPASGTRIDGSLTITLTPGKSGATIRYTTDGSDPTASSGTVYSGPITITSDTEIKAVTVANGVAGPVTRGLYLAPNFGDALGTVGYEWTSPEAMWVYPWEMSPAENTDGVMGVRTPNMSDRSSSYSLLMTTVTGPAHVAFRYNISGFGKNRLDAVIDPNPSNPRYGGTVLWGRSVGDELGSPDAMRTGYYPANWRDGEFDVPAGTHVLAMKYSTGDSSMSGGSMYFGCWLDEMVINNPSAMPTVNLASGITTNAQGVAAFSGTTTFTISPGDPDAIVRYTLDGSDPASDGAHFYDGNPVTVYEDAILRVIEIDPDKDPSKEIRIEFDWAGPTVENQSWGSIKYWMTAAGMKYVCTYTRTPSSAWQKPDGVTSVECFGVGGGAGGQAGSSSKGGDGGAGGSVVTSTIDVRSVSSLGITVGAGGSSGAKGGDSKITNGIGGTALFTAAGGAAGGGGAGQSSLAGAAGNDGTESDFTGEPVTYGGSGGGGGGYNKSTPYNGGAGGAGGGGAGGKGASKSSSATVGTNGTDGLGGGGGGSGKNKTTGSSGGSGIIILRYLVPTARKTGIMLIVR